MKPLSLVRVFAYIGFAIAVAVFFMAYFARDFASAISRGILVLCPPCFGLMANEFVLSWYGRALILIMITIENVIWYMILGTICALVLWLADRVVRYKK